MAFELKTVVPWGRNLEEYRLMFALTPEDLKKRIISFGDGPASFNALMKALGHTVTSIDPIYQFPKEALARRIQETSHEVLAQVRNNVDNFVWKQITDVGHLEKIRLEAMERFLADYERGKQEGRYLPHALPDPTPFPDHSFDLGLSSHFLILYSSLGLDFHLQSIEEMMRVCHEVRIFPLLNLNAKESPVLSGILEYCQNRYTVSIEPVDYEFQRNGNQMLRMVNNRIF